MVELLGGPHFGAALVAAVVALAVNGASGAFRVFRARRSGEFARGLELEVEGHVEVSREAGERLLYVRMRAHNAGGSKVEIAAATLEVHPRLLEREEAPHRSRELDFGEADVYEAFPGRAPGLMLVPGQSHPHRTVVKVPGRWSGPLKLRLAVSSREERWWAEHVTGVGGPAREVDNGA